MPPETASPRIDRCTVDRSVPIALASFAVSPKRRERKRSAFRTFSCSSRVRSVERFGRFAGRARRHVFLSAKMVTPEA
jgi:hypothetical protein